MNALDQIIADALAQSPDTVVHQLASEVVRLRGDTKEPSEKLFHKNCRSCICWNGDMCELISHICENGEQWLPSADFVAAHPEVAALVDFAEQMRASASQFSAALDAVQKENADLKRGGVVVLELTDDDLNRYSMDCDERDALEFGYKLAASRFASAGRTVIPPLTDDEIEERYRSLTNGTDELEREWCYKDCRWAYSLAVYRARVAVAGSMLGIGLVAVDAEELRALERVRMEAEYAKDAFQQMGEFSQMEGVMRALHELDALRTHQGGADHV